MNLSVDAAKAIVGLRPSFSAHVRFGERGAPVQFLTGVWWSSLRLDNPQLVDWIPSGPSVDIVRVLSGFAWLPT